MDVTGELVCEREKGLAVLRLNRPERMNTLSHGVLESMARVVPELTQSSDVRAILITGTGRAFCAGGDIGTMGGSGDRGAALAGMKSYHGWVTALRHSEKIVICAVNGAAAGGGFGLAMLADIVVAADTAFFKAAFTRLGAAPDYALGFTLPRAVGDKRATEILLSNRRVTADEALALGMVSRVWPAKSFDKDALEFGRELAGASRAAQLTKRLLREGEREAFTRYLELEAPTQAEAFGTTDFQEGVAAFVGRREPRFQGR